MSTVPGELYENGSMFVTVFDESRSTVLQSRQLFPLDIGIQLSVGSFQLFFELYNREGYLVKEFWDSVTVSPEDRRIFTIEIDFSKSGNNRYSYKDGLEYIETDSQYKNLTPQQKGLIVQGEKFFQQFGNKVVRLSHDGTVEYQLRRESLPTQFPLDINGTHKPNANSLIDNGKYGNLMLEWPKFYYKFTPVSNDPNPECPDNYEYDSTAGECVPIDSIPIESMILSAGKNHVCAVVNGELWTAGDNTYGQLARPTTPARDASMSDEEWNERVRYNYFERVTSVIDRNGRVTAIDYTAQKVVDVSCGSDHTAFIIETTASNTIRRQLIHTGNC